MGSSPAPAPAGDDSDPKELLLERYKDCIDYYQKASRNNKRYYKLTRSLTVILGALVTLISSMASAEFIKGNAWKVVFAVATPVLAAFMAIVGGFAQSFQWGATWSDMVITTAELEKQRDRIQVTPSASLNAPKEMEQLDDYVIAETRTFFQRMFGSGTAVKPGQSTL
jgi:hypothetical protein